jgi:putative N6-adenine-specific DNA methylase
VVFSSIFRHSGFVALKVKDAVVDFFRDRSGRRPNVDSRTPDLLIHVHISNQTCTVSLDSSGTSLHKRGYRSDTHKAPLNEVLAAGMLHLTGWKPESNLLDPMCGSGTIVIEAGLMAYGIPPGSFRKGFAFQNWFDYEPEVFQGVKQAPRIEPIKRGEIMGSDRSGTFVSMAVKNVENAGLRGKINIHQAHFEKLIPPWKEGTIIMNPPYGERLQTSEINLFYRNVGDTLKRNFMGYSSWILSANKEALKQIGLRTSKKITLYNGPMEVKFQKYELYQGSKKEKIESP